MSMMQLLGLYLIIGCACAAALLWQAAPPRQQALPSALAALVIWPLWVPFALAANDDKLAPLEEPSFDHPLAQRIRTGLTQAQQSMPNGLLSAADIRAIEEAVQRTLARLSEMDQQLKRHTGQRERLLQRLADLDVQVISPLADGRVKQHAARQVAKRHLATLDSLAQLHRREEHALDELANAIELTNAELALSQFGEATSLEGLKAELWLRLDALQEASQLAAASPQIKPLMKDDLPAKPSANRPEPLRHHR